MTDSILMNNGCHLPGTEDTNGWETVSSENIFSSRWVSVDKDKVKLPNGVIIDDYYKITVSDAAAVIAITDKNEIILKSEYRYCYNRKLIDLPSGIFEPGETDSLEVAKRELLEETGYTSDDWTYWGSTLENSAKLTNNVHLYLAKNCKKVSSQHLDSTEEIDVIIMPIQRATDMVMDGKIACNTTAHGILRVARMLEDQN